MCISVPHNDGTHWSWSRTTENINKNVWLPLKPRANHRAQIHFDIDRGEPGSSQIGTGSDTSGCSTCSVPMDWTDFADTLSIKVCLYWGTAALYWKRIWWRPWCAPRAEQKHCGHLMCLTCKAGRHKCEKLHGLNGVVQNAPRKCFSAAHWHQWDGTQIIKAFWHVNIRGYIGPETFQQCGHSLSLTWIKGVFPWWKIWDQLQKHLGWNWSSDSSAWFSYWAGSSEGFLNRGLSWACLKAVGNGKLLSLVTAVQWWEKRRC